MMTAALSRPRVALALIALVSFGALATALVAQYGFDLQPCVLCVYQRVPYAAALALGLLGLLVTRPPALPRLLVLGAGLAFLIGAGIAGFHVGVEQKWWAGTASCSTPVIDLNLSMEELQRQLDQASSFAACDEVPWSLFGISMAGYNLILSLVLAAVFLSTGGHAGQAEPA